MPFQLMRADITTLQVDAIVNAANSSLLGGGGVDGCIHRAAGEGLLAECRTLGGCPTGEVRVTAGYRLPCRYVIHAVGPVWEGGDRGERELLASCYRSALQAAAQRKCESVAFPLISAGSYGYPKREALRVAVDEITAFLQDNEMTVILTLFNRDVFLFSQSIYDDIARRISDAEVEEIEARERRERSVTDLYSNFPAMPSCASKESSPKGRLFGKKAKKSEPEEAFLTDDTDECAENLCQPFLESAMSAPLPAPAAQKAEAFFNGKEFELDESFAEMLLRKIDESGMTDVECYKRANIDRKLFSKIRSNPDYRPGKQTVLAFAVALRLTKAETEELLRKAGFALSHSFRSDVIIEYFIERGIYDIFTINEMLFAYDQKLLGA